MRLDYPLSPWGQDVFKGIVNLVFKWHGQSITWRVNSSHTYPIFVVQQKLFSHQGVEYGTGEENPPHQTYSGRTRQKNSHGRDLKRSPLSGSAGKKVDHSFFLVQAICGLYYKSWNLWGKGLTEEEKG